MELLLFLVFLSPFIYVFCRLVKLLNLLILFFEQRTRDFKFDK